MRAGAVALGIVGLLVLVAIAARGGHPSTGGHVSSRPNVDVTVILGDGKTVKAKTLGVNHAIDSGLIKISDPPPAGGKWPFAEMGYSGQLHKAQWCIALGHPGGFKTGRSHISIIKRTRNKTIIEITIREGRNPQVRRMLAKVGHKLRELTRVRLGALTLHGLEPGQSRMLTPREVRQLRELPREQRGNQIGARTAWKET